MILCHKCSGILAANDTENTKGLSLCSCISGYVRGFEPIVTREQAIQLQITQQEQSIALYRRQEREQSWIDKCNTRIAALNSL